MSLSTYIGPRSGRIAESILGLDFPRPMARAIVHLDARFLGLADGADVSSWPARPGSLVAAVAGTAPIYRATGLNGRPAVEFELGDWLDLGTIGKSLINAVPGVTIFAVGQVTGTTDATQSLVHISKTDSTGSTRAALRMRQTSNFVRGSARTNDADAETVSAGVGDTSTAPCIASVTINYLAGTVFGNVNGVSSAAASLPASGTSQAGNALAAVIGSGSAAGSANRFQGLCSFVAVFPMVVSAQRQLRIRQYLGRSFGITTV